LTTLLNALQFKGKVFCYSKFSAPWAIKLKCKDFAHFHFFESGQAWIEVEGTGIEVLLESGDLVILPHGSAHILRDNRKRPVSSKCRTKMLSNSRSMAPSGLKYRVRPCATPTVPSTATGT
jgi:Cupin